MNKTRNTILRLLGVASLVALLLIAWPGCKGDSTTIGTGKTPAQPLPVLRVLPATGDPLSCDPLQSGVWKSANWTVLTHPLNNKRTTPPTRVASFYDANFLYVAFLCNRKDATGTLAAARDAVEVWLDTSAAQNGTEMFCIAVADDQNITRTWHRSAVPPQPREDGTPNFAHPTSTIPDYQVPGLRVAVNPATGTDTWTALLAVPLKGLPLPLRPRDVKPGLHWRVNLVRVQSFGGEREPLQANFSEVYPLAQQVSPYRMADLVLEGAPAAVAFRPGL